MNNQVEETSRALTSPSPESLTLGIETSCDETAAAVLRGGREVRSTVVASQEELHARFGGVVPEVASRRHTEVITIVVDEALSRAGVNWSDLELLAVTQGPGLIGSLLVGVSAAKAYAIGRGLPLIGVNHLEGHVMANFVHCPGEQPAAEELMPSLCLIASGGHTDLVLISALGEYQILGWTRDDAAGEALDKGARVMGLGYPGGPAIDRAACEGNPAAVDFPRPLIEGSLDFSFSGLKTALIRHVQTHGVSSTAGGVADVAASFQQAIVDTLVRNTRQAAEQYHVRQILMAGGVAANSCLRAEMSHLEQVLGVPVRYPPPWLCTDNAAMIAAAGHFAAFRNGPSSLDMDTYSALPLAEHV